MNDADGSDESRYYGLYFPKESGQTGDATLLFEKNNFDPLKKMRVQIQNKNFIVGSRKVVRETAYYVQFNFSVTKT
jgi:hypothetical protein